MAHQQGQCCLHSCPQWAGLGERKACSRRLVTALVRAPRWLLAEGQVPPSHTTLYSLTLFFTETRVEVHS
jgi:hypothetical protein